MNLTAVVAASDASEHSIVIAVLCIHRVHVEIVNTLERPHVPSSLLWNRHCCGAFLVKCWRFHDERVNLEAQTLCFIDIRIFLTNCGGWFDKL